MYLWSFLLGFCLMAGSFVALESQVMYSWALTVLSASLWSGVTSGVTSIQD